MSSSKISAWKKIKRSGAFRRKVKKNFQNILGSFSANYVQKNVKINLPATEEIINSNPNETKDQRHERAESLITHTSNLTEEPASNTEEAETRENWLVEIIDSNSEEDNIIFESLRNSEFQKDLRVWAVSYNISHLALKALFAAVNRRFSNTLPKDPRTLLRTYQTVILTQVGNGSYWHHGLELSLKHALGGKQNLPQTISLNINMDGLPIYRSSKYEFWPILFNIYEIPEIKPMIIGIYCGQGKPNDLKSYLQPFVEEAKILLSEGLFINEKIIPLKLRCFICDSPARAFIKGVTNFNGKQGCLKCTTVGEYSYISHSVYFPRSGCQKRTNEAFRAKMYGSHHKVETPLSLLPIDMIEDFPIGDSLHLIDLGIMKKCLIGWRDGNFGNYRTKWCANDIATVTNFLIKCKMPNEIHRAVRGLHVLCHWKGSEYRTFLYYLGVVILKEVLPLDVYHHFLTFFCAITICSSKAHFKFLSLAEALLNNYVEYYRDFYGEDYITSNVHNLTHLVDEVKRFGPLPTFNSYPFESRLYQIKNLLRNGNTPLAQVAKRMSEIIQSENVELTQSSTLLQFPVLKSRNHENNFTKIEFNEFLLAGDTKNKWFLTKEDKIVAMQYATCINNVPYIYGTSVKNTCDVFRTPICSSYLHIFKSPNLEEEHPQLYSLNDVKCKLVCVSNKNEMFFLPLLHTLG